MLGKSVGVPAMEGHGKGVCVEGSQRWVRKMSKGKTPLRMRMEVPKGLQDAKGALNAWRGEGEGKIQLEAEFIWGT